MQVSYQPAMSIETPHWVPLVASVPLYKQGWAQYCRQLYCYYYVFTQCTSPTDSSLDHTGYMSQLQSPKCYITTNIGKTRNRWCGVILNLLWLGLFPPRISQNKLSLDEGLPSSMVWYVEVVQPSSFFW